MGGSLLLRSCNTCDRTTRLIARTVSQEPTEALPPTEMAFTRLATPSAPARQVNQIRARRCIQPACHQPHSAHQGHSGGHPLFGRSGSDVPIPHQETRDGPVDVSPTRDGQMVGYGRAVPQGTAGAAVVGGGCSQMCNRDTPGRARRRGTGGPVGLGRCALAESA